jgi:hypothetical protein
MSSEARLRKKRTLWVKFKRKTKCFFFLKIIYYLRMNR